MVLVTYFSFLYFKVKRHHMMFNCVTDFVGQKRQHMWRIQTHTKQRDSKYYSDYQISDRRFTLFVTTYFYILEFSFDLSEL